MWHSGAEIMAKIGSLDEIAALLSGKKHRRPLFTYFADILSIIL